MTIEQASDELNFHIKGLAGPTLQYLRQLSWPKVYWCPVCVEHDADRAPLRRMYPVPLAVLMSLVGLCSGHGNGTTLLPSGVHRRLT